MTERIIDAKFLQDDDEIFSLDFEEEHIFENKHWVHYLNIIASFDTETTSFIHNGVKVGYCYVWAMKIGNTIVTGRYVEEYSDLCKKLSEAYGLGPNRRMCMWVHNLGFDFQFIRKHFEFARVFSMDKYKPIRALTKNGIEFRDSYILTNSNLGDVANSLATAAELTKLKGDLDYDLMRHSETEISAKEWEYIYNDVRIVYELIKERMSEEDGYMTKIPMTSTGYVRRYVHDLCYPKGDDKATKKERSRYKALMSLLTVEPHEYTMLKEAFQGGFTHANCDKVATGLTYEHVGSYDITSSYPTVCIGRYFPMSKGKEIDCEKMSMQEFNEYLKYNCCLMNVTFYDIKEKLHYDNIISLSKCLDIKNYSINNGRIIEADELNITITDVDFKNYLKYYSIDNFRVNKMMIYARGFLPKPIITAILDLYEKKTTLKGVDERKKEYGDAKALLNAIYGMMVTDIVRDETVFDGSWDVNIADTDDCIQRYNKSRKRFLFYPWGVWVTAYARERLFEMIEECGDDYIYSDTDSVKILNPEKHVDFIDYKNRQIIAEIRYTLEHYNIDVERCMPKTIKGVQKPLGVWDFECIYDKFKTLGSKRYFVLEGDKYELTVAGVNKKGGAKYICKEAKMKEVEPMELFDFGFTFDGDATGKKTHIYVNDEVEGYMKDYNGVVSHFDSKSSIYLESANYNMTISKDYDKLLDIIFQNMNDKYSLKRKLGL